MDVLMGRKALPVAGRHPMVPDALRMLASEFHGPHPRRFALLCWLTGRRFHNNPIFTPASSSQDHIALGADGRSPPEVGATLPEQVEVLLAREPDNGMDANAILVRNAQTELDVGYVEMATNKFFTPLWDDGLVCDVQAFALRPPRLDELRYAMLITFRFSSTAVQDLAMPEHRREGPRASLSGANAAPHGFVSAARIASGTDSSAARGDGSDQYVSAFLRDQLSRLGDALVRRSMATYCSSVAPRAKRRPAVGGGSAAQQKTLCGPTVAKRHARGRLTGGRSWARLQPELLTFVFGSAVLDYVDVLGRVRATCSAWRRVVDAESFMPCQKLYWRAICVKSSLAQAFVGCLGGRQPPRDILGLADEVSRRTASWLNLQAALEIVSAPLEDDPVWTPFLRAALAGKAGRPLPPGASPTPGLVLTVPLVLAGPDARGKIVRQLLPRSFSAKGLHFRQERLELAYFVVLALRALGAQDSRSGNAAADAALPHFHAWENVATEIEHDLHLLQAPAGLIVPPPLAGFVSSSGSSNRALTAEQLAIVQTSLAPGEVAVVHALAGTGKTTTLLHYSRMRPSTRFLYIVFNVSVREEASRLFPENVTCVNVHKLAFASVGRKYVNKLRQELGYSVLNSALRGQLERRLVRDDNSRVLLLPRERLLVLASNTLDKFFASVDEAVQASHVEAAVADISEEDLAKFETDAQAAISKGKLTRAGAPTLTEFLLPAARYLWERMQELPGHSRAAAASGPGSLADVAEPVPMLHNGYLKLYQLSKPVLWNKYDVVMLDEAQDCSPCARDIVMTQTRCARLLVGDQHQAIYQFLGAQDALAVQDHYPEQSVKHFRLSRCFRFGPAVAAVANGILRHFKGETRLLLGAKPVGPAFDEPHAGASRGPARLGPGLYFAHDASEGNSRTLLASRYEQDRGRPHGVVAVICRTNRQVLQEAIAMAHEVPRARFGIVGDVKNSGLQDVIDMCLLATQQRHKIQSEFVGRFASLHSLVDHVAKTGAVEWGFKVAIVEGFQEREDELLELCLRVERMLLPWNQARHVLTTVHKSKGLEFDNVLIANDFYELAGSERPPDIAEVNLLYVAVTRARLQLTLNVQLESAMPHCSHFLLSPRLADARARPSCAMCGDGGIAGLSATVATRVVFEYRGCPARAALDCCSQCAATSTLDLDAVRAAMGVVADGPIHSLRASASQATPHQ